MLITNDPPPEPERRKPSTGSFFTAGALVRSLVLSLMDTADRIAEWLERGGDAEG